MRLDFPCCASRLFFLIAGLFNFIFPILFDYKVTRYMKSKLDFKFWFRWPYIIFYTYNWPYTLFLFKLHSEDLLFFTRRRRTKFPLFFTTSSFSTENNLAVDSLVSGKKTGGSSCPSQSGGPRFVSLTSLDNSEIKRKAFWHANGAESPNSRVWRKIWGRWSMKPS